MIIYDHRHQGDYEIPDWAHKLKDYYWMIRVQGRDKAKRRRYYRYVAKEKLRLVEQENIDQELLRITCRYLSNLHSSAGIRMRQTQNSFNPQLTLDF